MSEKEMWESLGKNAEIVSVDGEIFCGKIAGLTPAADNDNGEPSISLKLENVNTQIEFYQSEIKSYKIN